MIYDKFQFLHEWRFIGISKYLIERNIVIRIIFILIFVVKNPKYDWHDWYDYGFRNIIDDCYTFCEGYVDCEYAYH